MTILLDRKTISPLLFFLLVCLAAFVLPATAALPGTETQISYLSAAGCSNIRPSADSGWVVWEEYCPAVQIQKIYAYNYTTAIQLTLPNATLHANAPATRGHRVVWYEKTGNGDLSDLYYTDLDDTVPIARRLDLPASVKDHPAVDGNIVVWQEKRPPGTSYDIMLYDIAASRLYNLSPDTDGSDQQYPTIAGGLVVWQDNRDGENDLYYNDTSDWSLHSIPASPPAGVSYLRPVTDGSSIVWYDELSYDILQSDLATTTTLDDNGNPKFNPAVCSTFVAWKEDQSGSGFAPLDIALFNTATASREFLTDSTAPVNPAAVTPDTDFAPVILTRDSRVFWVDERTGNYEIYMFTYGPVTTCPVAQFSADRTGGNTPLDVRFTDTSLNSPTLWRWDFGDGSYASGSTVDHTFTSAGVYRVHLTAATPYCRNTTLSTAASTISVGVPDVGFSANVTEGLAPLPVAFTGTGTNAPTGWSWTFGDGGTSILQNPVHTYAAGRYPVTLEVNNAIGTGTKTVTDYINALNGMAITSVTTIPGISVTGSGAGQHLSAEKSLPYVLSPDSKTLVIRPSPGYGWQNITFLSDANGFTGTPTATTGTISGVLLRTIDIAPAMFPATVGDNLRLNYQYRMSQWVNGGSIVTQVWESESNTDAPDFAVIIHNSGYSTKNVAYTLNMTRNGISTPSSMRLNLSVGSDWETGSGDIAEERLKTYIIADGFNANGDHVGIILPATFIRNDTTAHIEYFLADVPSEYTFMNKFAFAKLAGTGNPFQLITLTVTKYASSPESPAAPSNSASGVVSDSGSSSGGGGAGGAVIQQAGPAQNAPVEEIPDPGKTATVFTNAEGVTSQGTILTSTDRLATISIGEGITAKDREDKTISTVSIAAVPSAEVPALPDGKVVSFAGRTYNLGPDGATFSPPGITITLTVPQAKWGQEYSIHTYDAASGTWQELPGIFDSRTGTVTARITHFCYVALVVKGLSPTPAVTATKIPIPVHTQMAPEQQPPSTALSIFTGMVFWATDMVLKNTPLLIGIVIACIIIVAWRGRRMNRGNY